MFPLHTPQIRDVAPPNEPQFPAVSICRSLPTAFLLPFIRLPPPASPVSHLLTASLASPWSVAGTPCVSLLPSSTLPSKGPISLTHTVESPATPLCRKLLTPWVLPFPAKAVSPVYPIPTFAQGIKECEFSYTRNFVLRHYANGSYQIQGIDGNYLFYITKKY